MHYVYLLKSRTDNKFYLGTTGDLKRRFDEHQTGQNKSTRSRKPFVLVYYEAYRLKQDAIERERRLKQFKNSYKRLLERLKASSA